MYATVAHQNGELVRLDLSDGSEVLGTAGHRYWSVTRDGWFEARALREGEALRTPSGVVHVTSSEVIDALEPVFNIEVEGAHEYFVGEGEVLVHNGRDCGDPPRAGDSDFVGPIEGESGGAPWRLVPDGDGAHLVERGNTRGRPALEVFDRSDTPRFYPTPDNYPENAGAAHVRLHAATRGAGIKVRGGNPNMTTLQMLQRYRRAYADPALEGVRGALRTPDGSHVLGTNLTPLEAYRRLLRWGRSQR